MKSSVPCALLIAFALAPQAVVAQTGSPECPCVTGTWPMFADLSAGIAAAGYPATYGLDGCRAYDQEFNTSGCGGTGTQPAYCPNPWCYIDPELCPVNVTECSNAGLKINDQGNPGCRSRAFKPSTVISGPAYYSYQTCGSLDNYDGSTSRNLVYMQGKSLLTTTTNDVPYTSRTEVDGRVEFGGVMVTFMESAMKKFDPPVDLQIVDGWATGTSREKFPSSSFTAAVYDTAVGHYDVVIGDFWVTSERMLLSVHIWPLCWLCSRQPDDADG